MNKEGRLPGRPYCFEDHEHQRAGRCGYPNHGKCVALHGVEHSRRKLRTDLGSVARGFGSALSICSRH
jgi:hypothetical protein